VKTKEWRKIKEGKDDKKGREVIGCLYFRGKDG